MSGIRLENVTQTFGGRRAVLENVCLSVRAGERLAIVGPSGAGKTSLLRLIAGFDRPTAGRIFIGERDVTELPPEARDIAFVFQNNTLYPHLTVGENLAFPLRLRGLPAHDIDVQVRDVAALIQFPHPLSASPAQLSGGESQMVALGRALIRKPAAILLDEPLSNVSPSFRRYMRQQLIRIHEAERRPFLYVTHDHEDALALGEQVAVMAQGRIEQAGTPREIYEKPASKFVAQFIGGHEASNFANGACVRAGGGIYFETPGFRRLLLAGSGEPAAMFIRPERLEVGPPEGAWAAGVISDAQYGGASSSLVVEIEGAGRWLVRAAGPRVFQAGEKIHLHADPRNAHFFGPADGGSKRLDLSATAE